MNPLWLARGVRLPVSVPSGPVSPPVGAPGRAQLHRIRRIGHVDQIEATGAWSDAGRGREGARLVVDGQDVAAPVGHHVCAPSPWIDPAGAATKPDLTRPRRGSRMSAMNVPPRVHVASFHEVRYAKPLCTATSAMLSAATSPKRPFELELRDELEVLPAGGRWLFCVSCCAAAR
jgi:hypothetical protein